MNHFMLPDAGGDPNSPLNASARYGTFAMEILINQLLKLGARRSNLEAKVFGGGNVIDGMTVTNVGQRNAAFVLDFLKTEKIKVAAQDLVDVFPRKVYFFPKSSKVMVKKLKNIRNNEKFNRDGRLIYEFKKEDGLLVTNKTVPFGNILIIYESRPDVTIEAAAMAFKSGNKILLKGGKEARNTNLLLTALWHEALTSNGYEQSRVKYLDMSREEIRAFISAIKMHKLI